MRKVILESTLSMLLCGAVHGGYAPNLPVGTELDRLLLRVSSRGGIDLPTRYYLQPYAFTDAEPFFALLDSAACAAKLSPAERLLLERARRRFGHEKGLFAWAKSGSDLRLKINLDLIYDIRPGFNDSATLQLFGIARPSLAGNLGKLSFYGGIAVWTEYRSDTLFSPSTYQPRDGIAYNLYGRDTSSSVRSSDLPHGGIRYDAGRIDLETAIDRLKCGPARFFPLTLSGYAPPVTYFRGSLDLDIIDYQHVVGLLKVDKDKRKYLYLHRLSTDLWKQRVHLGINEVIIYGNTTSEQRSDSNSVAVPYRQDDRAIEWGYLIPMVPFTFVEHYAGDRDNAAISMDLSVNWPVDFRWYGELFLDDMLAPWKIFTNDWGNKWALTIGGNWFGRLLGRDLTVQAEYSRVEPWVYTHFGGGSHRYTHFNGCLGSPMGPNSQAAVLSALLRVHPIHEVGIGLNHYAWNHSVRGGTITDVPQLKDPLDTTRYYDTTKKRFLGPGTEWHLQPALYWNVNLFGRIALNAAATLDVLNKKGRFAFAANGGLYF
ncbi:MAG: hypothetical protein JW913_18895 [Chitinispirillaceae bacterium]|nr:hypothetical protein [Chitinispirillaceae bacterium]